MRIKTSVKAGRIALNHNQALRLRVKSKIKAGKIALNPALHSPASAR